MSEVFPQKYKAVIEFANESEPLVRVCDDQPKFEITSDGLILTAIYHRDGFNNMQYNFPMVSIKAYYWIQNQSTGFSIEEESSNYN